MLAIAWQTVRGRLVAFIGMFVALLLSVWLLTVMALTLAATFTVPAPAPERFAKAPAVVYPADLLRVETSEGVRTANTAQPGSLPTEIVKKVQTLGRTVQDRTVPAQMVTVDERQIGRPWPVAAFAPHMLTAGRAPRADSEIVVIEGQARLQDSVRVVTAAGPKMYTVSGLVKSVDFESPIFFTDAEATRLTPAVSALVSYADPKAIRSAVGDSARVLTGAERYRADPDPNRNQKAMNNLQILLGIAGGFTVFVSIFVVASTFAFVVAQRLREFALLRAVGALPSQVRQMVLLETVLVGLAASFLGSMAGTLSLPLLTSWLIDLDVAPAWFQVPIAWLPVILACVMGVSVALLGAWAASLRAAKTRPLAALRAAVLDEQGMTKTRWFWAWSCLIIGLTAILWIALTQQRLAIIPQIYFGALMLPVVAAALFAPATVPPLTRFITWPLSRLQGATGLLARQNALTAIPRTVATAVPVLLVVALFASLLGANTTITAVKSTELAQSTKANYVVVPDPAAILSRETISKVRGLPAVRAIPAVPLQIFALEDGELRSFDAEAVDQQLLPAMLNIPLEAGSFGGLKDDTIVVGENWEKQVGQKVNVWFADGTKKVFTVAAVMKTRVNPLDAYVTSAHAQKLPAAIMYVKAEPPASFATLQETVKDQGAKVMPTADWAAAGQDGNVQASHAGMLITLGIIGVYCAIALVNTLVIASAGRLGDITALRLAGATHGQIYRFAAAEALVVVVIGAVLAVIASVFNVAAHYASLSRLVEGVPVVVPWAVIGITIGVCAALAIPAAILPLTIALRKGARSTTPSA